MLQPYPYPSPLAPHPEQVLQIFAAKWIVAQDGITSTPLRIDRMRLVLLGKYGHETEEKKTPLVRKRRPSVRSPQRDLHPSPPPTPVALALALTLILTLTLTLNLALTLTLALTSEWSRSCGRAVARLPWGGGEEV